jgi:hypothetical protein
LSSIGWRMSNLRCRYTHCVVCYLCGRLSWAVFYFFVFFLCFFLWGVTGVEEITMRLVTHTRIGEVHSRKGSIVPDTGNVQLRLYSLVESVESQGWDPSTCGDSSLHFHIQQISGRSQPHTQKHGNNWPERIKSRSSIERGDQNAWSFSTWHISPRHNVVACCSWFITTDLGYEQRENEA